MQKIIEQIDSVGSPNSQSSFIAAPSPWPTCPLHQMIWNIAWQQTVAQYRSIRPLKIDAASIPQEWFN
jgi:hypothetical protein